MSDSVQPQRRHPTRLPHPWDSSGKNTGVGCRFLLQCMKVKSESEVAQSCPTLSYPMDCSLPGSSIHGIYQARVLEWVAIAFSIIMLTPPIGSWVTYPGPTSVSYRGSNQRQARSQSTVMLCPAGVPAMTEPSIFSFSPRCRPVPVTSGPFTEESIKLPLMKHN